MRGFPLINGALILLALGLALVPLLRLTSSPVVEQKQTMIEPETTGVATSIGVRYAHPPTRLTLSHLDDVLWTANSSEEIDQGAEVDLALTEDGIDLLLSVDWPEGTPRTALEITLEPDALRERVQVLWGSGTVEDILTFQWNE